MKHSANIYNELQQISPFLAEMEKSIVFSVPEKYFEALTNQIVQRIPDPFFALPASEPHFSGVPEGYFDNLPLHILNKIKKLESNDAHSELRELSPMLYAVQNENVYTVPKGYFEDLPDRIVSSIQPKAKVVSIKKRRTAWNYAYAAMLAGVIALSALWVTNKSPHQTAVEPNVKTVSPFGGEALKYKNQQEINEGIAGLNDDEIITYLEITGNNTDDDLLAGSVPETDLPAEEDYLLNDKTLDTYLNKIDVKTNQN